MVRRFELAPGRLIEGEGEKMLIAVKGSKGHLDARQEARGADQVIRARGESCR